jgi:hypothetical protein
MRTYEICHHLDQATKIRQQLGDMTSDPTAIQKPKGMRTKVFENRIKRLHKHESQAMQKLCSGLAGIK